MRSGVSASTCRRRQACCVSRSGGRALTAQKNEEPQEDLSSITGDAHGSAAANIGRDGDALVQDEVVYGTETERQGTGEDREREMKERKVP